MLRILAGVSALAVGATVVLAQNSAVIDQRRSAMDTIAKASLANFNMMKGEAPFDLAKVQAGLETFQVELQKFKNLFPEDSKKGDTDARPKIWDKKSEFDSVIDKFVADAKTVAGKVKDEATFKAEYPIIPRACGNCHKEDDGFAPSLKESFKRLKQ